MPPNRLIAPHHTDEVVLLSRLFLTQYQMRLITLYGGEPGVEHPEMLEEVLREARIAAGESLHGDVLEIAAIYALGLSRCPFRDGNLRLATVAMVTTLRVNDYEFDPPGEALVDTMKAVAAGSIDKPALIEWLSTHSRKLEPAAE